jgi:putative Holliday junction resolvase
MIGRIVCLDVGERRIGVSQSDLLGLTAQPVETFARTGKTEKDYEYLAELLNQHEARLLVVGLPKNMNNSIGFKAEEIQAFVEGLKGYLPSDFPIEWVDERLTTVSAENVLLEANVSRKKRKNVIDKLAAVFILQTYLDSHPQ